GAGVSEEEKKRFSGQVLEEEMIILPDPPQDAHKYSRGAVQIIGGAEPYGGAPLLASLGALKAGAGYVVTDVLQKDSRLVPADFIVRGHEGFEDVKLHDKCQVHLIGPGMGRSEGAEEFLKQLFEEKKGRKLVLDADALFFFDRVYRKGIHEVIVTPHLGEFSRMTGRSVAEIRSGVIPLGQAFAREKSCVLVLKSHGTVIFYPDGEFSVNPWGNPYLATMGSGDILSGVVAALWARGFTREHAAAAGVLIHSRAGDRLVEEGDVNFTAADIAAAIPKIVKRG
ncbi:MAG TPA: NAD(P)H-hydrate dehydratase, partial [Firmicutes bacterium]|nr:NAD(P)H-hydrate dehydratase [Bacillota bacterium]